MQSTGYFPKIIIDGVFFQIAQSGIAQVWSSLLKEWIKTGFSQHILLLDRGNTAPKISKINYYPIPLYNYHHAAEDSQLLQEICDQQKADLFISTYYTTPLSTPSVLMVHDMIPEVMEVNLKQVEWQEKHYGILHACHYIAVSRSTAKDLQHFFLNIKNEQITLAYNGIKPIFSPSSEKEIQTFREKYNLHKPYFILVGDRIGIDNYKNAIYVFKAFSKLENKQDYSLLFVGGKPQLEPEFLPFSQDIDIHILPLNDEELKNAYSGAITYINPSLYEGFGLPILEAMACGCPVITGDHSSIPEVAGKAAYYINLNQESDLITAINRIQDPHLRQELIQLGFSQIQQFSWSKMAETVSNTLLKTIQSIQDQKISPVCPLWLELRQQKIKYVQDFKKYQLEYDKLKRELEKTQQELQAMRTSKFWQIRTKWFKVKKSLGFSSEEFN